MDELFRAIAMASRAHEGQTRKLDGLPYISHPLAVAMVVQGQGGDLTAVLAAILHDTLEDTGLPAATIAADFGPQVLAVVEEVTEHKALLDWRARKVDYIRRMEQASPRALLVSAADKVHNLHSMASHLDFMGESLWSCFKKGRDDQAWYYRSLHHIYAQASGTAVGPLPGEMVRYMALLFP